MHQDAEAPTRPAELEEENLARQQAQLRALHREAIRAREAASDTGSKFVKPKSARIASNSSTPAALRTTHEETSHANTPKNIHGLSIDMSRMGHSMPELATPRGATPQSSSRRLDLLKVPQHHEEKNGSDMGEMGYLHLKVHGLVNLDERVNSESRPNLNRALFSAELVTSDYSRKKTIFTNGDITRPSAWGAGLYFRIFQADKEAQFELKASQVEKSQTSGANGDSHDFGLCRLAIVPALDLCLKPQWQSMRDRMGNVNTYRILVTWKYVSKLNNVRASSLGILGPRTHSDSFRKQRHVEDGAPSTSTAAKLRGTKLIFDGLPHAFERRIKCIREDELLDKLCCAGPGLEQIGLLRSMLLQQKVFRQYRKQVQVEKWERFIEANPFHEWWEEPSAKVTMPVRTQSTIKSRAALHEDASSPSSSVTGDADNVSHPTKEAAKTIQRVYRGHLGRIANFFIRLRIEGTRRVLVEREKILQDSAKIDAALSEVESRIHEMEEICEGKRVALEATEELQNKLKQRCVALAAPRMKAEEQLQASLEHEKKMKILVRSAERNRERASAILLEFSKSKTTDQRDEGENFDHAKNVVQQYQKARRVKEEQLGLEAIDDGSDVESTEDSFDAVKEAERLTGLDVNGDGIVSSEHKASEWYDRSHNLHHVRTIKVMGLQWHNVGRCQPEAGVEIACPKLAEALRTKTTFSREEFDEFELSNLTPHTFIKVEQYHFQPADIPSLMLSRQNSDVLTDANLRLEREIRSSSAHEMDALDQLAAAFKARQKSQEVVADRSKERPEEREVLTRIQAAAAQIQQQRDNKEKEQALLIELKDQSQMLREEEMVVQMKLQGCDAREQEILNVALRGLSLYDKLQQGISPDEDEDRLTEAEESSNDSDASDIRDLQIKSRQLIEKDLVEAYNSVEPTEDMREILQEYDLNIHNCQMLLKPAQGYQVVDQEDNLLPCSSIVDSEGNVVAFDEQARYEAKKATFRFLYDQIQRGSGILRSLDSTTLQPVDVLKLMDICTLQGCDAGESIFEQNSEGDEWGIVMTGHVKVLYNRRDVSNLIKGQAFCDLGLMTPGMNQIRGASFRSEVRSYVILMPYQKFADRMKMMGSRFETAVKDYLQQSHSIGRENWSQYGNAAKSIEICFLEFMSRQSGLLGLLNMVEVRNLANLSSYRKFKQNEVLCSQGDPADSMYVVLSGLACVVINGKNVAYITRGQELGELGLIQNFCNTRTATIIAHYDFEVAMIKYTDFFEFFEMMQPKRALEVAKFVATCALPKYFMLSEWKREAIAQGDPVHDKALQLRLREEANRRAEMAQEDKLAGDIQTMLDAQQYLDTTHSLRHSGTRALESPFNRLDRLPLRKGRDGADPFSRRPEEPSEAHMAFVNALLELARSRENDNSLPGSSRRSTAMRSRAAKFSTPSSLKLDGSRKGAITDESIGENSDRRFVQTLRSKTLSGQEQDKSQGHADVSRDADAASQDSLTARDDRCHLARKLKPHLAARLETFSRQARSRNFIGKPSSRLTKSSLSEGGSFRFSPLAAPVGVCGWSTHLAASASPRLSRTKTFAVNSTRGVSASAKISGLQGKLGVRQALSSAFANVAEAFVAFDRLGTNFLILDELHASLMELGLSKAAVSEALQDIARGEDRMSAQDFLKHFAWHPIGSSDDQQESLAEAQSRRFAIITSLARAGAANRGMGDDMTSFRMESMIVRVIRKNLGPIRALFAEGGASSNGFKTEFVYEQEMTREHFEDGLRTISDLGLSEHEVTQVFDVFDVSKSGKLTFADIEQVFTSDANAPVRNQILAAGLSIARKTVPGTDSGPVNYRDCSVAPPKYRPHSAKVERPSALIAAAKMRPLPQRPMTARSRMYTPRKRPLSARNTQVVGGMLTPSPASPSTAPSQSPTQNDPANQDSTIAWQHGQKLLLLGRYDESLSALRRALDLEPSHTGIMTSYAKALIDGYSDLEGAREQYHRALAINPADVSTLRLLGNLERLGTKDLDAAEKHFNDALAFDPLCIDTLQDYADLKASNGDEKGALTLYRRILQEDPANPVAASELYRLRAIVVRQQQEQTSQTSSGMPVSECPAVEASPSSPTLISQNGNRDVGVKISEGNQGDEGNSFPINSKSLLQDEQGEQSVAQGLLLDENDAEKAGIRALVLEWGDTKTESMKLGAASAPLWMEKCLAKLEETLTMAESFHEVGDTASENVFRRGFSTLLKLFYLTDAMFKQGDLASTPVGSQVLNITRAPAQQDEQMTQPAGLSQDLNDFIASRANEAEKRLHKHLCSGWSVDESVALNFPTRSISTSKVPIRLHEIDLPQSVRDAIQKQTFDRGPVNWRAGRVATRPSTAPRGQTSTLRRPGSSRHVT